MKTYFLRTNNLDMKSYGGFQWPTEVGATVEAPDWNPTHTRGHTSKCFPEPDMGLHVCKHVLETKLTWL